MISWQLVSLLIWLVVAAALFVRELRGPIHSKESVWFGL